MAHRVAPKQRWADNITLNWRSLEVESKAGNRLRWPELVTPIMGSQARHCPTATMS